MLEFKKSSRLLKRRDFTKVSRSCQKRSGKWLYVEFRKGVPSCRLGITVTRKFGKSHDRNRFKRLVREAYRHLLPQFTSSFEMIVRPKSKPLKMQDILADLKTILHDYLPSEPQS